MVKNTALKLMLFTFLSVLSATSFAETKLHATVDRSKIYEMDTLNLTIQGQVDIDFSFGGLMNFGLGQNESPDIAGLENDFEILDTQQSYNMQSINGESKAQVLWKYTLAPKNSGVLEIPAAKYKDAETQAIQITVIEGKAPKNASEPPAIFLEVETDKQSAYVQEQILYTLRLYTQGLVNGELTEPSSTDAIIEPFGEQKKYYKMAFNQRYEVVERQYLIFPQKSGALVIDEQTFQGVSLKHGRRARLKDMSDAVKLTIKPPASSFSGKNWLPATSLFLNEEWQGDINNLQVGDSITRKIELSSLGLLGSALPPISMSESPLYKLYVDKPQTESLQHSSGAQSKRVDSFAIVAINEGDISLDEIRIPWWDTVNDVERVAIIPAQNISIAMNPQLATAAQGTIEQSAGSQSNTSSNLENDSSLPMTGDDQLKTQQTITTENHLWQTATGVLLILWMITTVYLYKKLTNAKNLLSAVPLPKQAADTSEKEKFNDVLLALKNNDKRLTRDALNWLKAYESVLDVGSKINSLQDIKTIAPDIYEQLTAYEEISYARTQTTTFESNKLLNSLKNFRDNNIKSLDKSYKKSTATLSAKTLEPFYQ